MAHYDIILKGGTIVDGTRIPRYVSDLAIKDGKVAKIGGLRDATATQVLDAKGLSPPGLLTSTPTTTPRSSGIPTAPSRHGTA